jgi:hypothetical protein
MSQHPIQYLTPEFNLRLSNMSFPSSIPKENDESTMAASETNKPPSVDAVEQENEPQTTTAGEINAADEVKGIKLALVVLGLCFSNILTGLVREVNHPQQETVANYFNSGLHIDSNRNTRNY